MTVRHSSLFLACTIAIAGLAAGSSPLFAGPLGVSATSEDTWITTSTQVHELRADSSVLGIASMTKPLHVEIALRMQNRDLLDEFVANQHNPTHFYYKAALQPEDVIAAFSPSDEQAQAVVDHLRAAGFTNISVAANRLLVSADGTTAAVQTAFQARIADVVTGQGQRVFANIDGAKVPAALGGTVLAVLGLQTESVAHTMAKPGPDPFAGKPGGGSAGVVGHNPTAFASIYGAGSAPTASNVTVGIIAEGNLTATLSDLTKFTSTNGLPAVTTQTVVVNGASTDTSGTAEWDLDSQDIVGITGGVAKLVFYDAHSLSDTDLTPTYNKAVIDNVAKVINISLGECETSASNSGAMAADDQIFAAAQAQGQTFSASSGDSGANECGHGRGTTPSYPASSPYLVAVGGTTLTTTGTGNTTWNGETVWSGTGGSPSTVEPRPSWQTSITGTKRGVPDVAFDADPNSGAQIYVNGSLAQYGGTSLASPLFVGTWARMLSGKPSLGFAAPHLYTLSSSVYHDVTSGNNSGETATVGWDYCTGFGSMLIGAAYNAL